MMVRAKKNILSWKLFRKLSKMRKKSLLFSWQLFINFYRLTIWLTKCPITKTDEKRLSRMMKAVLKPVLYPREKLTMRRMRETSVRREKRRAATESAMTVSLQLSKFMSLKKWQLHLKSRVGRTCALRLREFIQPIYQQERSTHCQSQGSLQQLEFLLAKKKVASGGKPFVDLSVLVALSQPMLLIRPYRLQSPNVKYLQKLHQEQLAHKLFNLQEADPDQKVEFSRQLLQFQPSQTSLGMGLVHTSLTCLSQGEESIPTMKQIQYMRKQI